MTLTFKDTPQYWGRVDWQILRDGGLALYWRKNLLAAEVAWLAHAGYAIYEFTCDRWSSVDIMHDDISGALAFPDYYGKNFEALGDCLEDLVQVNEQGIVFVLHRFDSFWREYAPGANGSTHNAAFILLDVLAKASRYLLLNGKPCLVLVQSDDPQLALEPVGAVVPTWNRREWLDSKRVNESDLV